MPKQTIYKTSATGASFAIATPYHLSSYFGLQAYLADKHIDQSALAAILSLTVNFPHLCGLGGDCIIMKLSFQSVPRAYNGTGRTGSGHSIKNFVDSGKSKIGLRGWESSMVYGAPMALNKYSNDMNIDIHKVISELSLDILKGIPASHTLNHYRRFYAKDLGEKNLPSSWKALSTSRGQLLRDNIPSPASSLLQHIASAGFESMYKGLIGEICSQHFFRDSGGLFVESDILDFSPPDNNIFRLNIFGATISMVAYNTPWLELSVLLKMIAFLMDKGFDIKNVTSAYQLCLAASAIDAAVSQSGARRTTPMNEKDRFAAVSDLYKKVVSLIDDSNIGPITSKGSDTVFMGVASADGTIVGITNSIFTPFGSLIDPGNVGLLLSNRAFSFSLEPNQWNSLRPREPAPHTANVIIVEGVSQNFTVGTTGGPVQVQILAQLIYRMIVLGEPAQAALEAPRFANLGSAGEGRSVVLFAERRTGFKDPRFAIGDDLSPRMGVAQVAGVEKQSGRCYGATDPRGEGVALAI